MKVSIRNIGKVASADIELSGLTAIIGDNDMGKSTTGKALYALFRSMDNIDKRIHEAQLRYVTGALRLPYNPRWASVLPPSYFEGFGFESRDDLFGTISRRRPDLPAISSSRLKFRPDQEQYLRDLTDRVIEQVNRVRTLSREQLLHAVVSAKFDECFDEQYLPNYIDFSEPSSVRTVGHDADFSVRWESGQGTVSGGGMSERDVWFIGTPLVLDALSFPMRRGLTLDPIHNELVGRLRRGKMDTLVSRELARSALRPVFDLLDEKLTVPFTRDGEGRVALSFAGQKAPLRASNLSMGMKVFSVLRLMLESNLLRNGDVVVFDEPENHLHPGFQELFAHVVVKIQRIFGLRMLITTHSPYFLQALELYSRKESHETGERRELKVYQPEVVDPRGMVSFADVSGDTSRMYRKFAMAMREMDILRREVDGYHD